MTHKQILIGALTVPIALGMIVLPPIPEGKVQAEQMTTSDYQIAKEVEQEERAQSLQAVIEGYHVEQEKMARKVFVNSEEETYPDIDSWIPTAYIDYAIEIAEQYELPPELIVAIIETESSGQAGATNGPCKGLMQVNASLHADRMRRLGVYDIYDPKGNILTGTDLFAELYEKYDHQLGLALMAYNGQPNAIARYRRGNLADYALKIMRRTEQLKG